MQLIQATTKSVENDQAWGRGFVGLLFSEVFVWLWPSARPGRLVVHRELGRRVGHRFLRARERLTLLVRADLAELDGEQCQLIEAAMSQSGRCPNCHLSSRLALPSQHRRYGSRSLPSQR